MIRKGDSPEGTMNKFIDRDGDGHRGILVAVSENRTKGIVIAVTSTFASNGERKKIMEQLVGGPVTDCEKEFDGIVTAGKLYLVSETDSKSYPMVVKQVTEVPEDFEILR